MMKTTLIALAFTLLASVAAAQTTATPGQKFGFDTPTQAVVIAESASYRLYVDSSPDALVATGLSCTALGAGATCQIDIPAMTPGLHTVVVAQVIADAESAPSNMLSFRLVVVVTPTNLRIVSVQ